MSLIVTALLLLSGIMVFSDQGSQSFQFKTEQDDIGIAFVEDSLYIEPKDTDSNNKYDELIFSIQIQSNISATVDIGFHISEAQNGDWLFDHNIEINLIPGTNSYSVSIPAEEIYSTYFQGKASVNVNGYLKDANENQWIGDLWQEFALNYQNYEIPSIYLLLDQLEITFKDTNNNGLTDYIEIIVMIKSSITGWIEIGADFEIDNYGWIDGNGRSMDITEGTHNLILILGTTGLHDQKIQKNGSIDIGGRVNPDGAESYQISRIRNPFYFDYLKFDPPRVSIISEGLTHEFVDTDNNGLYDYVDLIFKLNVTHVSLVELWANMDSAQDDDNWRHVGHGNLRMDMSTGIHEIKLKISGYSISLSKYTGNVSINVHGDVILNEQDDLRYRISDRHLSNIYIDYTKFELSPIIIDTNTISIQYIGSNSSLNQANYDFARIRFDVNAQRSANIDFWVDVNSVENYQWFAGNGFHGDHDIESGTTPIMIDIDGRDLYSSNYEGDMIFVIHGWIHLDDQVEYDYPDIENKKQFSYTEFNPEGRSPINEEYDDQPHDENHDEESSTPGLPLPVLNYLLTSITLIGLITIYKVKRRN